MFLKIFTFAVLGALLGAFFMIAPAQAQQSSGFLVAPCVTATGGSSGSGKIPGCPPVTSTNPLPVSGTFSASLAGFTPTPSYAVLSASDALNHSVATPTGTDEVITNKDTNIAYCNFGAASTTSTFPVIAGQSIGVHFGGTASTIQCQSPSSTLNIAISGGSGLFAGAGGGGGGGSGGVVQQGLGNAANPWTVSPCSGCVFPAQQNGNWTVFTANTNGTIGAIIQAGASAPINISTATTTQLVAAVAGQSIYVTSWDVIAAGTGNLTLEYGTGVSCGTGTTTLTGAYNLTAQSGIAKGNGLGPVLIVPSGNALCALTSAAVQMSGSVAYSQF